jgi:hypothetical protein
VDSIVKVTITPNVPAGYSVTDLLSTIISVRDAVHRDGPGQRQRLVLTSHEEQKVSFVRNFWMDLNRNDIQRSSAPSLVYMSAVYPRDSLSTKARSSPA